MKLIGIFWIHNRLAVTYKMLKIVEQETVNQTNITGNPVPVISLVFNRDQQADQRQFINPTSNEISMVL